MKCGLVKNYKGNLQPPCKEQLDDRGKCAVHCRARLRGERAGRFCVNFHVRGRSGCRMHGGKSKRGLENGNASTLEYSRYMPVLGPKLKKRVNELIAQANALSLLPDIAVLDARIEMVMARGNGESSKRWTEARRTFERFAAATEKSDKTAQVEALTILGETLRRGADEEGDWSEVKDLWRLRAKMVTDERRNQLEHSVHKGLVFQLLEFVAKSVERNVSDPTARKKVGDDIARYTGASITAEANEGRDLGTIG